MVNIGYRDTIGTTKQALIGITTIRIMHIAIDRLTTVNALFIVLVLIPGVLATSYDGMLYFLPIINKSDSALGANTGLRAGRVMLQFGNNIIALAASSPVVGIIVHPRAIVYIVFWPFDLALVTSANGTQRFILTSYAMRTIINIKRRTTVSTYTPMKTRIPAIFI